jgi:hypothetical protein
MKENEDQLASPVKEECLVNSDPLDQEAKMDLKDQMVSLDHLDQRDLLDTRDPLDWLVFLVSEVFPGLKVLRVEEVIQAFLDQLVLMAEPARGVNKASLVLQDPLERLEVLEIQGRQDLSENRDQLV